MNILKKCIAVLLFAIFAVTSGYTQSKNICGTVYDSKSKTVVSLTHVWINNTVIGTITDYSGKFCISNVKTDSDSITLVCSRLGYRQKLTQISIKDTEHLKIYIELSGLQLEEVVVSGNKGTHSNLGQTTLSTVISKQAIVENGVQNIPEILHKQAGVSLAGQSYHAAPSIRGLARKRVLVLVDGEKVSSERNVGAPGTFLNPFEIDHIEILKGPYSTLYGSDAIGGVVNIVSKKFEQPLYNKAIGGRMSISYKSVNSGVNTNLSLNGKTKKLQYRLSSGYRHADNYLMPNGERLKSTFFTEKHIAANLDFNVNDKHALGAKFYYSKGGSIGKPAYDTLVNAEHDPDDHFIAGVSYKIKNIGKYLSKADFKITRHEHKLGAKITKHKLEDNSEDDKLIKNKKNLSSVDYIAQADFYLRFNDKLKLVTGFDGFFRQDINIDEIKHVYNYNSGLFVADKSAVLLNKASQNNYGLFIQADYFVSKKVFMNAGVRWAYVKTDPNKETLKSKKDQAFSGNLGLSFKPAKRINIKLNAGTAFRTPDIKELYVTTNTPGGLNISKQELTTEHSLNLDMAVIYKGKNNMLELSVFRNQIDNMIILDWDNTSAVRVGYFKNIGEALLYGFEMNYKQKITSTLSSFANITYIRGYDVNTDDELMDVPPVQINLGIKYKPLNRLRLSLTGRYSAQQNNVSEDDFVNDDFLTFDFSAHINILKNFTASASVSNILDEEYREHYQFERMYAPKRSFNIGVNFKF